MFGSMKSFNLYDEEWDGRETAETGVSGRHSLAIASVAR